MINVIFSFFSSWLKAKTVNKTFSKDINNGFFRLMFTLSSLLAKVY